MKINPLFDIAQWNTKTKISQKHPEKKDKILKINLLKSNTSSQKVGNTNERNSIERKHLSAELHIHQNYLSKQGQYN